MKIITAQKDDKEKWNRFVEENFPPIGAFMQTWEWGEFQQELGRNIKRYLVNEEGKTVAVFMVVHHVLPLGFSYGYASRGPVIAKGIDETETIEIFKMIKKWAEKELPYFIFLRLEPPISLPARKFSDCGFYIPSYYTQPRYNTALSLDKTEEEIFSRFHPSTRSNIKRAEKRGVAVEIKNEITNADYKVFCSMMDDTIKRHHGTNAYPGEVYFNSLFKTIPLTDKVHDLRNLSLGMFYGYQNKEPIAIHFVLFFGSTATYLYGASYSKHLQSKVMTYLHFTVIKEAKRLGFHYYDLGGIDEVRWKTLTDFKRQFRGEEFNYMGNIDIVLQPTVYWVYNLLRAMKR